MQPPAPKSYVFLLHSLKFSSTVGYWCTRRLLSHASPADDSSACAQVSEVRRQGGEAQAVGCDVKDEEAQEAMFNAHAQRYGSLDAVFLNAGVMETGAKCLLFQSTSEHPIHTCLSHTCFGTDRGMVPA